MQPEELEEYYKISDFCIVSLNNNEFFKNTIPSKVFQIMGRGKNIIYFGPEGEASSIISNVDDALIFTEETFDCIVGKINKFINERVGLKEYLYKRGEKFIEVVVTNYDRNNLAEKYEKILLDLC